MASGNGRDITALLIQDIEALKASSRAQHDETHALSGAMATLGVRMDSLSETMAELAKAMGTMARAMAHQSTRSTEHERLYGRLAKTLIALKDQTDGRFDKLERRVDRVERGGNTKH